MSPQDSNNKPVKPIQELLTREVNRTEFLSIVGLGALTLIGLGPIIHFLTGKGSSKTTIIHKNENSSAGFGAGPYGV
jgi:hypothetical protein